MKLNERVKIVKGPYSGLVGRVKGTFSRTIKVEVPVFSQRVELKLSKQEIESLQSSPKR